MRYANELDKILHCIVPHFYGVVAMDKLPELPTSENLCFIVNSDPSYREGKHWMGVYIVNKRAIFIEPFGLPLHKLLYSNPLNLYFTQHALYTETLPFPIQPVNSDTCGEFCAYILSHLPLYQYSLNRLATNEFLPNDLEYNRRLVEKWWLDVSKSI